MWKTQVILYLLLQNFLQIVAQVNPERQPTITRFIYTNPITRDTAISMRDHFIIKVDKKWFCVGISEPVWTGPNPGVRLLVSGDLIHSQQHSFLD